MPKKPPPKPPVKQVNWEMFEQLCALHCTQTEMASMFKMHQDTLSDKVKEHYGEPYTVIYKKFQESGKCSLRRYQFNLAKTNTAMAIWLGKQWLGQRDNQEIPTSPNDAKLDKILNHLDAKPETNHLIPTSDTQA